jgi:hypothetical protein
VHGITSLLLRRHGTGPIDWREPDRLVDAMLELLVRGTVR